MKHCNQLYHSTSVVTLAARLNFFLFMFASLWSLSIQAPKTAITTVRTAVSYWWVGKVVYYCCYPLALTDIRSISQHADVWFKVSECVSLLPLEMTYTPSVLSACLCICCICCICCTESCQWINSETHFFMRWRFACEDTQ